MSGDGSHELPMAPGAAGDLEALREQAATALQQGLGFVERNGDEFALLRAHVILEARSRDDALAQIAGRQDADGGFPLLGLAAGGGPGLYEASRRGLSETLLGMLEALVVLADLSALSHPCLEATAHCLSGLQLDDGSWGRSDENAADRLFATGMLAGLLGRTRFVRPEILEGASAFMDERFSPEGVEEGDWSTLVSFGVFFTGVVHDLGDEALQWIGRALERGFRTHRFDASLTLRMLLHCGAMAVPGATLSPDELLRAVLAEQGPDGGFAELTEGGAPARVSTTVDGLLGIIRLCQALG